MKLENVLTEIITIDTLSDLVAYFEVCFQGALGFIASFSSGFDPEDATERLSHMQFELVPQAVFSVIIRIALESEDEEQMHNTIKKAAAHKALEDLLEKDNEILNRKIFFDQMDEMIESEIFFDARMEEFIDINHPGRLEVWRKVLTDEMIQALKDNLKTLETDSQDS